MSSNNAGNELRHDLVQLAQLRQIIALDDESSHAVIESTSHAVTGFGDELSVIMESEPSRPMVDIELPLIITGAMETADPGNKTEVLRRCLELNLEYQAKIRSYIDFIKKSKLKICEQIARQTEEIRHEKDLRIGDTKDPLPSVYRFATASLNCFRKPYFRSVYGIIPPPNEDLKTKCFKGEQLPCDEIYQSGWNWNDESMKEQLLREVRRECLTKFLEPHIQQRDELRSIVAEVDGPGLERAKRDLEAAEQEIKRLIREIDSKELFMNKLVMDRVDWLKVAKNMGGQLTATTCNLVWNNYLTPLINKRPFTVQEDAKLKELAISCARKRFVTRVTTRIGTNRSTFQLLQRYQANFAMPKGCYKSNKVTLCDKKENTSWRREDDKRLLELVSALDLSSAEEKSTLRYIDWQFVAQNVGNFSKQECVERYIYLTSNLNRGNWSDEEDKRLNEAVETYGTSTYGTWIAVANYVQTRSPAQCQSHYQVVMIRRNQRKLLGERGCVEWTAADDAVLWFNRNSTNRKLRQYNEIAQLLPGRLKTELEDRFKLLKLWQKHAEWIVRNKGTLLSLVLKSDAELSFAEVEKLKSELIGMQTRRTVENDLTNSGKEGLASISFAEQGQLEHLTNAMILEANMSRELVRDKAQLLCDIVGMRAAPVPLMRNLPSSGCELEKRELVHGKIKEMLIKAMALRRLQEEKRRHRGIVPTFSTPKGFAHLMRKFTYALRSPRTMDKARALLLRLESVKGGEKVRSLIEIASQLNLLLRRIHIRPNTKYLAMPVPYNMWTECTAKIRIIYRPRSILLGRRGYSTSWKRFYKSKRGRGNKFRPPLNLELSNSLTKLLVLALGTNLLGVTAEASRQLEAKEPESGEQHQQHRQRDENNEDYEFFSSFLPLGDIVKTVALLRRYRASQALRALEASTDDPETASSNFASIREEFDETAYVSAEDFADNDLSPVFPPNSATTVAYRSLLITRLRLQDMIAEKCAGVERQTLLDTIERLKERPTEGYALLQRRFEALFTWPSVLERVHPSQEQKGEVEYGKKKAPLTVADVPDFGDPNFGEDLEVAVRKSKLSEEALKYKHKFHLRNPFLKKRPRYHPPTDIRRYRATVRNARRILMPPPTYQAPRSERIKKLFEEGRIRAEMLGALLPSVMKRRATCVKKMQEIELQKNLQCEEKQVRAERQLNFLFPFVPLVPLDDFPAPESRIPKVPAPVEKSMPVQELQPVDRLDFAMELAERAMLRFRDNTVSFENRDNSFPPIAPLPPPKHGCKKKATVIPPFDESVPFDFCSQICQSPAPAKQQTEMGTPSPKKLRVDTATETLLSPTSNQVAVTVFTPGAAGATEVPMTLISNPEATVGGQALLQLSIEDALRLFGEGRDTVAIAVPLQFQQQGSTPTSASNK